LYFNSVARQFIMKTKGQSAAVATAEPIPENTDETHALDKSEREYNRMISQHMTYHKMMMDDLMKLSTMSESAASMNPAALSEQIDVVSGLGTTVSNIDSSNKTILKTASRYVDKGKQNANTVSNLNAYLKMTGSKLTDDINAYDKLAQKEGFSNTDSMDAALEISQTVSESQKYALVVFGAFALFLLYKTVKHL
jgi:hypothetical protein